MNDKLQILAVVTHPHDFIHCAATCGIHAQRGDAVTVVSVTDGAGAHNERLYDELLKPQNDRDSAIVNQPYEKFAAMKADEFRRACAVFGVTDVRIFRYTEPYRMHQDIESVEQLRQIIGEVRPDVMVTHRPYLRSRHGMVTAARDSHDEVAFAVLQAMDQAASPRFVTDHEPHTIGATYYLGGGFSEQDVIHFYVETSAWYDKIVEAEMMFESQGHDEAFSRRRIEAESGVAGWSARTRYAEDFQRSEPELFNALPVPHEALSRARGGAMHLMKRMSGTLAADQADAPPQNQALRIMVVTAQPYDFLHCAATCGIHTSRGDKVTAVCFTDGGRPTDQTRDEFAQACALFGVDNVRCLSYLEPFHFDSTPDSRDALGQIIAETRPDVLVMHAPYLRGRSGMVSAAPNERVQAAVATWDAMMSANQPDYRTMRRPHAVAAVFYLGESFPLDQIDFCLDIADWVDKRIEAEALFDHDADSDVSAAQRVDIETRKQGAAVGIAHAESFLRGSLDIYDQLPVPASALRRARSKR